MKTQTALASRISLPVGRAGVPEAGAARMNVFFDRFVHPTVRVGPFAWSRYMVCGYAGLLAAVTLGMSLAALTGLSTAVMATNVLVAVAAYLLVANVTRLVTGERQLTYYHHELAILGLIALRLWAGSEPVLPYLDITVLGVGAFLACGRVGCLMVGCCHGRPWPWGVYYGREHTGAGFGRGLAGVRVFPVQALESAWVLATVGAGATLVLGGAGPGAALSLYVAGYGAGRFAFEFLRGDADRRRLLGVSEAQWTSALLALALAGTEAAGVLEFHAWHAAIAAVLGLVSVTLVLKGIQERENPPAAPQRSPG